MKNVLDKSGKAWSYEDYLSLDDHVPFEIIAGRANVSPAPELFHQRWVGDLFMILRQHVKTRQLGEVFIAPVDVVLDQENVVQPDLVFISAAHAGLLERRGIMGAPDLVVEVISPGSLRRDRYEKRELYARSGVQEFWLADVANRFLEVLTLQNGAYHLSSFASGTGKVTSTLLSGLELDLAQLD